MFKSWRARLFFNNNNAERVTEFPGIYANIENVITVQIRRGQNSDYYGNSLYTRGDKVTIVKYMGRVYACIIMMVSHLF